MVEPNIALPILIFVSSLFPVPPVLFLFRIWPIFDFFRRHNLWLKSRISASFVPHYWTKLKNKPQFRCMYSEVLLLAALIITSIVIYDWSNCDKIESACFYALSIPAWGVMQECLFWAKNRRFYRTPYIQLLFQFISLRNWLGGSVFNCTNIIRVFEKCLISWP